MIASIILALHLLGLIPAESAITFLYIVGAALVISELFVGSFGMVAFNGAIALYVAYALQTGDHTILGFPLDWGLVFGVAFTEIALIGAGVFAILHSRKKKNVVGPEAMIGMKAEIVEWHDRKGRVRAQGEIWQARTNNTQNTFQNGDTVTVADIKDLTLYIEKQNG